MPTLATLRSYMHRTRPREVSQRTQHERVVVLWIRIVVGTCVGLCVITAASLALLFVHPPTQEERQLSEEEMFLQENPDDYNGSAAEALLRAYDARRRATIPASAPAAEVSPSTPDIKTDAQKTETTSTPPAPPGGKK